MWLWYALVQCGCILTVVQNTLRKTNNKDVLIILNRYFVTRVIFILDTSVSASCSICDMLIFRTECGEAGKPVAHERVQDERPGLWRPTEDGGEGAERRPPARSSLSLQGQNSGQRHAGHPGERSCKQPNGFSSTSSAFSSLYTFTCTLFLALRSYIQFRF